MRLRPPHRPWVRRAAVLRPWASKVVSCTVVAALAYLSVGQGPAATGAGQPSADAPRSAQGIAMVVSSDPVVLKRRQGTITGDGRTVYVANRTTFRPRRTTVALPPPVRAKAWAIVDLDTGRLLGRYQHRARLPQASTLKLLTAVTATRTIPATRRHRVSRFEAGQVCSCLGIRPGATYTRDTLVTGMLLVSGNDAAEAVAGSHGNGRTGFYSAMSRVARNLGARDTVVRNASGLTAAGAHSSARDLVLFLRAAVADPTVHDILATRSTVVATVHGTNRERIWRTTDYVNRYDGSLGKSGWTTPAQNTLAVVSEVEGRRIAVATLGAPTGYSTSGARALTEWAGDNITRLVSVGRLPRS